MKNNYLQLWRHQDAIDFFMSRILKEQLIVTSFMFAQPAFLEKLKYYVRTYSQKLICLL